MAFAAADLDAIDAALLELGTGARTAQVRFADGRTVQYQTANMDELMRLRGFIAGQVATGADPANQPGGVSYASWGRD